MQPIRGITAVDLVRMLMAVVTHLFPSSGVNRTGVHQFMIAFPNLSLFYSSCSVLPGHQFEYIHWQSICIVNIQREGMGSFEG